MLEWHCILDGCVWCLAQPRIITNNANLRTRSGCVLVVALHCASNIAKFSGLCIGSHLLRARRYVLFPGVWQCSIGGGHRAQSDGRTDSTAEVWRAYSSRQTIFPTLYRHPSQTQRVNHLARFLDWLKYSVNALILCYLWPASSGTFSAWRKLSSFRVWSVSWQLSWWQLWVHRWYLRWANATLNHFEEARFLNHFNYNPDWWFSGRSICCLRSDDYLSVSDCDVLYARNNCRDFGITLRSFFIFILLNIVSFYFIAAQWNLRCAVLLGMVSHECHWAMRLSLFAVAFAANASHQNRWR